MSAATQIYYAKFDAVFLKLTSPIRARVQAEIDRMGLRPSTYPHHRLKGSTRFRARIGDYRIIYTFDVRRKHDSPARHRSPAKNLSSNLTERFPRSIADVK